MSECELLRLNETLVNPRCFTDLSNQIIERPNFFGRFLWFHTTNQECIFVVIKQKTLQIEKGFFGKEIDQLC